jgi:GTP-binding protein
VERILNMVDGVLLVVDCVDGPKPQTRFVLKKALEKNLTAILVVNKMDRPQARPSFVVDRVFDLFSELNASDEQMDFKIVYASGESRHVMLFTVYLCVCTVSATIC